MTTIIVIVVVALVFFVAVCIIAFMIWKREAEMRTDSIRAIEENLERLAREMSPEQAEQIERIRAGFAEKTDGREAEQEYAGQMPEYAVPRPERRGLQPQYAEAQYNGSTGYENSSNNYGGDSYMDSLIAESSLRGAAQKQQRDPFGWVRESSTVRTGSAESGQGRLAPDDTDDNAADAGIYVESPALSEMREMLNELRNSEIIRQPEQTDSAAAPDNESEPSNRPETENSTGEDNKDNTEDNKDNICEAGCDDNDCETAQDSAATENSETAQDSVVTENSEATSNSAAAEGIEASSGFDSAENGRSADREDETGGIDDDICEISLDFTDDCEEDAAGMQMQTPQSRTGYDVGRSGRRYTASELDALIKE
jgi:hypothetical protein